VRKTPHEALMLRAPGTAGSLIWSGYWIREAMTTPKG
jgi:hypothetical protein